MEGRDRPAARGLRLASRGAHTPVLLISHLGSSPRKSELRRMSSLPKGDPHSFCRPLRLTCEEGDRPGSGEAELSIPWEEEGQRVGTVYSPLEGSRFSGGSQE